MDRHKWRKMTRGNWSFSNNDSDAVNWIRILHFWCWITQINLH